MSEEEVVVRLAVARAKAMARFRQLQEKISADNTEINIRVATATARVYTHHTQGENYEQNTLRDPS